jgi:hypothetical protein
VSTREEGERENDDRTEVVVTTTEQGRGTRLAGVRLAGGASAQ